MADCVFYEPQHGGRGSCERGAQSMGSLTKLLAEHTIECSGPGEVTCRGCRDKGWMSWATYHAHLAAVIEASEWLAAHDRELAAGARQRACLPHDDLTEQTIRDGLYVCVACGRPDGIEQPPTIRGIR